MQGHQDPVENAIAILDGKAPRGDARELHELAQKLKQERAFPQAQRIYALARRQPVDDAGLARKLRQQHALCTYKNTELINLEALSEAIGILDSDPGDPLASTDDPETLCIAGAIHKRMWEVDAREKHLRDSLAYYRRAWAGGPAVDDGYAGINAAYVLDLLGMTTGEDEHSAEAREIRQSVRDHLEAHFKVNDRPLARDDYWAAATLAEAHFGLQAWEEAEHWLRASRQCGPDDWMLESTARQLASTARIQRASDSEGARSALQAFLGDAAAALDTLFAGKVGLGLSGGGFRASLFHIGVLAKLAELDLLRHVEVLSCVSGGSILGAHYYLVLRRELERTPDAEIDYLAVVEEVARTFVDGVKSDIRNSVFKDPRFYLRSLTSRDYNRSVKIAELYEERLYRPIVGGEGAMPLHELGVAPHGRGEGFHPRRDNWKRRQKVPALVLNATSLNTGHTWQFTTRFMGEPPAHILESVDGNYRLRRVRYQDAPGRHRDTSLGSAVAASACVPGLFRPLVLTDLYPGKTVRLVDGGVRDNQGVLSLLEQDCTVMIVSDASGQMGSLDEPGWLAQSVALRSQGILQSTIRAILYRELDARRRSSLREMSFLHMKKDLDVEPVSWLGGPAPVEPALEKHTAYGIPKRLQAAIASIRTDLDAFSDDEAHALMLSGYLQAETYVSGEIESLSLPEPKRHAWPFLRLLDRLEDPALQDEIEVGSARFFRAPRRWWRKLRGAG